MDERQRRAKLVHSRDELLASIRRLAWDKVEDGKGPLHRIGRGVVHLGEDAILVKALAALALGELGIADIDLAEGGGLPSEE